MLETERLLLRPASPDDAPFLQHYVDNWNIIKYLGGPVPWPYPPDGAETHLKLMHDKMTDHEIYLWAICLRENPAAAIGLIEYRFVDDKDDNRGFWLAEPFWVQGLMTEAIEATQDFVFNTLGKERLLAKNAESNLSSRRVKEKTGWRLIGSSEGTYHTGETREEIWELTRDAWSAFKSGKHA